MNDWLQRLASALGVDPLSREETGAILEAARDVAHGVERKFAPLSSYLIGVAVGHEAPGGSERVRALRKAVSRVQSTIPPSHEDVGASEDPPAG